MLFNSWAVCSVQAREIVRVVLTPHIVAGLRTQEIFNAGLSQFPKAREPPPPPRGPPGLEPPHLGHPLRSMRFLKKIILPDMMAKGEVEKVHISEGRLNEEGQRMDVIASKGYGKTVELNVAKHKSEWRWRLIPEDKIEHHKEVVARLSPKEITGKIKQEKPVFKLIYI